MVGSAENCPACQSPINARSEPGARGPRSIRLQQLVVLCALPMLEMMHGPSFSSACLPQHYLDMRWSTTHLGLVFTTVNLVRLPSNLLVGLLGEWLCLPIVLLCAVLSIPAVIHADRIDAVALGMVVNSMTSNPQAWRVLSAQLTPTQSAVEQTNALRILQFSEVLGYSVSSLLGGFLYDVGGYRACALFQLTVSIVLAAALASLPAVRHGCRLSLESPHRQCRRIQPPPPLPPWKSSNSCTTTADGGNQDEQPNAKNIDVRGGWAPGFRSKCGALRAKNIMLPVGFCLGAGFLNSYTYVTEWTLYALYFRQVYNWGSTSIGAAQMAGDLLAGLLLLFASVRSLVLQRRASAAARQAPAVTPQCDGQDGGGCAASDRYACTVAGVDVHVWGAAAVNESRAAAVVLPSDMRANRCQSRLSPPHSITILLLLFSGCFAMLASSTFAVAVLGQVAMGTIFVLMQQAVQESIAVYGRGDISLYRSLVSALEVAINVANSCASFIGLRLYAVDRVLPFYVASGCLSAYALIWSVYFHLRFRRILSPGRRLDLTLEAAEAQLHLRRGTCNTNEVPGGAVT